MASEWTEAPQHHAGPSGYRRRVAVLQGSYRTQGWSEVDFATRPREVEDPDFVKQVLGSA